MKTQIKKVANVKKSSVPTEVTLKPKTINANTILRGKIKGAYLNTFKSANGIIKFCKGEGVKETQAFINYLNKNNESKIKLADLTLKAFLSNLTDYERFKSVQIKDSKGVITYKLTDVKKVYFSTHQVCNVLSRLSKK